MKHGEIKHSSALREYDLLREQAAHGATTALGYAGKFLTLTERQARPGYYFCLMYKIIGPFPTPDSARAAFDECKHL